MVTLMRARGRAVRQTSCSSGDQTDPPPPMLTTDDVS